MRLIKKQVSYIYKLLLTHVTQIQFHKEVLNQITWLVGITLQII